jgi:hypothetical protein
MAVALRGEYLADPTGFLTGQPQRLGEVTATVELPASLGRVRLQPRAELRRDQSSVRVFDGAAPGSRRHQDTLTLALAAWF